jgi:hypothetical protein
MSGQRTVSPASGGAIDLQRSAASTAAARIDRFIEWLKSLHGEEPASFALIECGPAAAPALREVLYQRDPSGIFGPRCRAAKALAGIRAHEVLLEFLKAPHEEADLVARVGEETLLEVATSKEPSPESESPSSLRRRRNAPELLLETGIDTDWQTRRRALIGEEDDPMLAFLARKLRLLSGGADNEAVALQRPIALLPDADWFLVGEIEDCLVRNFAQARDFVDRELKKIGNETVKPRSLRLFRTLQRVEARAEAAM